MIKHVGKIALFIAIFWPFTSFAQVPATFVTPNGTVIDWYGNIISTPVKPAVVVKPSAPLFTAPMKSACASIYFKTMDLAHKEACMAWWLKQAPIQLDGGSNMPQVWYNYHFSK